MCTFPALAAEMFNIDIISCIETLRRSRGPKQSAYPVPSQSTVTKYYYQVRRLVSRVQSLRHTYSSDHIL